MNTAIIPGEGAGQNLNLAVGAPAIAAVLATAGPTPQPLAQVASASPDLGVVEYLNWLTGTLLPAMDTCAATANKAGDAERAGLYALAASFDTEASKCFLDAAWNLSAQKAPKELQAAHFALLMHAATEVAVFTLYAEGQNKAMQGDFIGRGALITSGNFVRQLSNLYRDQFSQELSNLGR